MDDDGNGTLSLSEMKEGLLKNNMPELAAEIEKTMADLDNDGLLSLRDFMHAVRATGNALIGSACHGRPARANKLWQPCASLSCHAKHRFERRLSLPLS